MAQPAISSRPSIGLKWLYSGLIGLLLGALANLFPGHFSFGAVGNFIMGLGGAVMARWAFADLLPWGGRPGSRFSWPDAAWSIAGAFLLIFLAANVEDFS